MAKRYFEMERAPAVSPFDLCAVLPLYGRSIRPYCFGAEVGKALLLFMPGASLGSFSHAAFGVFGGESR